MLWWLRKWESFVSVSASVDILEKEGTGKSGDNFHRLLNSTAPPKFQEKKMLNMISEEMVIKPILNIVFKNLINFKF